MATVEVEQAAPDHEETSVEGATRWRRVLLVTVITVVLVGTAVTLPVMLTAWNGQQNSNDLDECHGDRHGCHDDASCTNSYGSYSCHCNTGYSGNGKNCTDINECLRPPCSSNATCANTKGSYVCQCNAGYSGDGFTCTDINECLRPPCGSNATCANTKGSYVCQCHAGYSGDGFTCIDVDECTDNSHECDSNAVCTNTQGSHVCTCNSGYEGNGTTCTQAQYRGLNVSSILSYHGSTSYFQTLSSYLDPVINSSSSSHWTRCWRAQKDGWAASTFHSRCDNKGPTVTIVRVGNYVFGGYSDVSWNSYSGYTSSSSSFLYTLYNTNGYYPIKLTLNGSSNQLAIYRGSGYGPVFGGGNDLHIADYASSNQQSHTYPHTYSNPGFYLAGTKLFTPSDVEVFYETT